MQKTVAPSKKPERRCNPFGTCIMGIPPAKSPEQEKGRETVARPITFRMTPEAPQSRRYPKASEISPRTKRDRTLERRSSLMVLRSVRAIEGIFR
jgi:hypothetical protein